MKPQQLIACMRSQREFKVEVEPGKVLIVRRPADARIPRMVTIDAAIECVVGWQGITEADLVTSGASDPVEFDASVCAELLLERTKWIALVIERLVREIERFIEAKQAAEKN